jgi:hypothetical protein
MIVQRGGADLLHEQLAQHDEVLDEQMGLILARAIAGRDPGVPLAENVRPDRRRGDGPLPLAALDPVGEYDEPAAPVRRNFDQIIRVTKRAAPTDGGLLSLGTRWVGPQSGPRHQREHEREACELSHRVTWSACQGRVDHECPGVQSRPPIWQTMRHSASDTD